MSTLLSENSSLVNEWHPTLNSSPPNLFTAGSGKVVWWLGSCGHEWEARIAHRSSGSGCPTCRSNKVTPGVNDLATSHPTLSAQWDFSKNATLTPENVTANSSKKVWWIGECEHEWETTVSIRSNGGGCPFCSGQKVLVGFNDLGTTHPRIAEQWVHNKNAKDIKSVSAGSRYKATWTCKKGHEWETAVKNRTRGQNCPYCSNNRRFEGLNDLTTLYPYVASQWDFSKNTIHNISSIPVSSSLQVWWKCEKGHEWFSSVKHRTYKSENCPVCYQSSGSSQMEQELFEYVAEISAAQVFSRYRKDLPFELDIYVPDSNLAIEFNGLYWHTEEQGKGSKYHYNKWNFCREQGIQLIQIWEDDWVKNPELIKTMLSYKLNQYHGRKVYARDTVVKELTQKQVDGFLNVNHIQGAVHSGIRFGLFEPDGSLVAVLALKREPSSQGKTLNLLRYATSLSVVGGFTKLLKHVERIYNPVSIITFSDNTISDGGLYESTGFELVSELKPDYMYVVKGERFHKFNYRLKRFRSDASLKYVEGLTERELAQLNNLSRIWDAGKRKWEKVYLTK